MFADDYRAEPFWYADAALPEIEARPLPPSVDVLVVGGGYTGLCAARETALAGRSTCVLDAGAIGSGCSSRNGGQVSFSLKPSHEALKAAHGQSFADGAYGEALDALTELSALVSSNGLSCDWRARGGFVGAHTRRHFDGLLRDASASWPGARFPAEIVTRARLHEEIDSPLYCGGLVYPDEVSVHPLKLLRALFERAQSAGVEFRAHCAVRGIERREGEFMVETEQGRIRARQVLIATNGYTGAVSPWHARRVIPIGSYIIATEPLDPDLLLRLIPQRRNVGDTRRVVVYVRPSDDGRRLLFGGRAAARETDVTRCVPRMHAMMSEMFPALRQARVSRAWMGFVGFTFDRMPHVGEREGLFYAMGYCGQGIPLATYYGRKVGLRMVGQADGDTVLWNRPFTSRAYYRGFPWFLPMAIRGYRVADRLGL